MLQSRAMKRATQNQAIVLMLLLFISVIVGDALLESLVPDPARTAVVTCSLIMGLFWIMEHSPAKWPKRSVAHKLIFGGAVILGPLATWLLR